MPKSFPKGKKMLVPTGKVVEFFTLAQVAKICGDRRAVTLRRMEEKKQFPPSNFRGSDVKLATGNLREGPRLYSKGLIEELVPVFETIRVGVKTPDDVLQKMRNAFQREQRELKP